MLGANKFYKNISLLAFFEGFCSSRPQMGPVAPPAEEDQGEENGDNNEDGGNGDN